jgi:hypothetical protein
VGRVWDCMLCTFVREEGGDGEGESSEVPLLSYTLRYVSLTELGHVCQLLFIIRVKRELERVYRNGCRYNERLNAETGGSKTSRTHWVARVNIKYRTSREYYELS